MSSIAQEEIRKLSERVRFGYKRSVEKGIVPGSNNIYGYTKNKGKLVIDEEQRFGVKHKERIKELYENCTYYLRRKYINAINSINYCNNTELKHKTKELCSV